MKNRESARGVLVIASLSVLLLAAVVIIGGVGGGHSSAQENRAADQRALVEALRRDGMRGAARLKGNFVGEFDPHWDFGLFNIEALTRNSAAVVVGVATKKLAGYELVGGGRIFTDYEVLVQETIKGYIPNGGTITVSLPGGRIEFEDGTSAELKTPGFEQMKTGETYTLFLSEVSTTPGLYALTGGPQGLVEMREGAKVKSHGRPTDPIAEETKDKDKDAFLREVRKQGKNWPHPGKCCS